MNSTPKQRNRLGRRIVKILRHKAKEYKLPLTEDGFVTLNDLFALMLRQMSNPDLLNLQTVKCIVAEDNKQRMKLVQKNGKWMIRANQGHSIGLNPEKLLTPITKIMNCIHGTYINVLPAIQKEGLKRMSRDQIHFTTTLPGKGEVISGMRKSVQVAIFIDMKTAMEDGIKFYLSSNGVILSPGKGGIISSKYFSKIVKF